MTAGVTLTRHDTDLEDAGPGLAPVTGMVATGPLAAGRPDACWPGTRDPLVCLASEDMHLYGSRTRAGPLSQAILCEAHALLTGNGRNPAPIPIACVAVAVICVTGSSKNKILSWP